MKLIISKINYKIRCEVDGCRNMATLGISGREDRPSGRLHLCDCCMAQLAQQAQLVRQPPKSPVNIFKKALFRQRNANQFLKEEQQDDGRTA